MKVIIAGSRTIEQYVWVEQAIQLAGFDIDTVVSGAARGVDQLGEKWARVNQKAIHRFPANWKVHGRAAGPIRNIEMAKHADALIAVWDGSSRGTDHMIQIMKMMDKPVFVHTVTPLTMAKWYQGQPVNE